MHLLEGLDWGTYYFFRFEANRLALRAPHVQGLMEAGDWLGGYLGTAVLLALAIVVTPRPQRPRMALAVLTTFLMGALLVEGVKIATARPRPPDAENILGEAMSSSFPSRAVFFAAFAWMMVGRALEHRVGSRAGRVVVYLAAALGVIFVCVSELWLALHFVTDVLAALAGGVGLGMVGYWLSVTPEPVPAAHG
jgi:membrane-associated phospholipid phosphatase